MKTQHAKKGPSDICGQRSSRSAHVSAQSDLVATLVLNKSMDP